MEKEEMAYYGETRKGGERIGGCCDGGVGGQQLMVGDQTTLAAGGGGRKCSPWLLEAHV